MVAEYIAAAKTAYEMARAVKDATDALNNAEIKLQMADLISALADLKIEAAESAEDKLQLMRRITELESQLNDKQTLFFDNTKGLYFKENEVGTEGPFCPACNDSKGLSVRLHDFKSESFGRFWECKVCKSEYP